MSVSSLSPTGVPRVDPRRPALITPAGLRRIVLGSLEGVRAQHPLNASHGETPKPVRSTGPFSQCSVVVTHAERGSLSDGARQALAAAAILASPQTEVVLAVLGPCHEDVTALGADRTLMVEQFDPAHYQLGASVQWLLNLQAAMTPAHWLFADSEADGDLGRRFAVASQLPVRCAVVELSADAVRTAASPTHDALSGHTAVMLLRKGAVGTKLPFVGLGQRAAAPALETVAETQIQDLGVQAGNPQSLALEEADLIVAAGNGVNDVPLVHALAETLGAAVGASRVAVDDGRFHRGQQIGATGKTVTASAYIAIGISGAVQHLQGIKDCRHVIAINLDGSAPIARRANLTVVEDSSALMQALNELARQHKEHA